MRQYARRNWRGSSTKRRRTPRSLLIIEPRIVRPAIGGRPGPRRSLTAQQLGPRREEAARRVGVTRGYGAVEHGILYGPLDAAHPWSRASSARGHDVLAAQRITHLRHGAAGVEPRHALFQLVDVARVWKRRRQRVGARHLEH